MSPTCERCGCPLSQGRAAVASRRIRGRSICRPCGQAANTGRPVTDWSRLEVVDGVGQSCQQIAQQLGVTPQAVRQIEQRAIARVRAGLEALGLEAAEVIAYLDSLAVGRESCEPKPCDGGITRRGWRCPVCRRAMGSPAATECSRCRVVVTTKPRYAAVNQAVKRDDGMDDVTVGGHGDITRETGRETRAMGVSDEG